MFFSEKDLEVVLNIVIFFVFVLMVVFKFLRLGVNVE